MNKSRVDTVLWDIEEDKRDLLPADFIIKRALVYGGVFLVKEMFDKYGIDKTKTVFNSLKVSELGEKRFNFFNKYIF